MDGLLSNPPLLAGPLENGADYKTDNISDDGAFVPVSLY